MHFSWSTVIAPEETIQKEFTLSVRYQKGILLLSVVLGVAVGIMDIYPGITVFILGCFYWYYTHVAKHYAFTSKRIILVDSFLGTNIISIDYTQVTDIEIEQSALDALFGWGTIVINTAGTHVPEIRLTFIDNPQDIKKSLDAIRDESR